MDTREYEEIAALYAGVFAPPPWNEFTKHRNGCESFFGLETKPGEYCPKCGTGILEEAYPLSSTVDYIKEELAKPNARIIIREDPSGKPIAFGWGYCEKAGQLATEKYSNSEPALKALEQKGIPSEADVFYISEVGVQEAQRGQCFGSAITLGLLGIAEEMRLDTVLRTNRESPMVKIARKLGMDEVQLDDPDGRLDRVLFSKKRGG